MKLTFKRITSSGNFIPEIDGLRFIAIASVILVHLSSYITLKDNHPYKDAVDYTILKRILSHGSLGVPLFFVISGFILGLPFAKYHLLQEKKVNMKNYFFRRLTRLEPPYILVMTLAFVIVVFVAKSMSFKDGIVYYTASIFYIQNFISPDIFPKLNGITWSLEVEVQFYILAPLLAHIFSLKKVAFRRMAIISIAILFLFINSMVVTSFLSLFNYVHYFFIGFLLADLFVSNSKFLSKSQFDSLIAFIFFCFLWLFERRELKSNFQIFCWDFFQLIAIFFFYYYVLFHKVFKLLSLGLITNIGGMCYSIYLLHMLIISALGFIVLKISFSSYSFINTTIYGLLIIVGILIVSAGYYLLIERPCMDRNWYKKILKRKTGAEMT